MPEARAKAAGSKELPGTRLLVSPEQVQTLKDKGRVMIAPRGFGTGYFFSTSVGATTNGRATPEQEKMFGITPLWVETFDHD